jgi:hypothetical protein
MRRIIMGRRISSSKLPHHHPTGDSNQPGSNDGRTECFASAGVMFIGHKHRGSTARLHFEPPR